jgi:DNA-directed RNA polymerase subunit H
MPRWCSGLAYKPVNSPVLRGSLVTRVQIPSEALLKKDVKAANGGVLTETDISKHKFVPKHVILNDKEKKELLKKYNITLNQLPRIITSDPMVKKLDAKVGDVLKITRISSTAGNISYYRVVVKGSFK